MGANSKAAKNFAKQKPTQLAQRREKAQVLKRVKGRAERDATFKGREPDEAPVLERHAAVGKKLRPKAAGESLGDLDADAFMERGFFNALEDVSSDDDDENEPPPKKAAAAKAVAKAAAKRVVAPAAQKRAPVAAESESDEDGDEGDDEDYDSDEVIENDASDAGDDDDMSSEEGEGEDEGDDDDDDDAGELSGEEGDSGDEMSGEEEDGEDSSDVDSDGDGGLAGRKPHKPSLGKENASAEPGSKKKGHRAQLEALKARDPEFFKYLEENDRGLLDFGADGDGDEDEDDDEDSDDGLDDDDDDDDDAPADGQKLKPAASKPQQPAQRPALEPQPLTSATVRGWRELLAEQKSVRALRAAVSAFRTAVRLGDDTSAGSGKAPAGKQERAEKQAKFQGKKGGGKDAAARDAAVKRPSGDARDRFVIVSADVFNDLLRLCLEQVHVVLDFHLLPAAADGGKAEKKRKRPAAASGGALADPTASARWPKLAPLVKSYLGLALELLGKLAEAEMAIAVVGSLAQLLPYLRVFPLLRKRLLKALLEVWSTSASTDARLAAYGVIARVSAAFPAPALDLCMKGAYLAFARSCKLTSRRSLPHVVLMTNCLVDLYGRDGALAYQHGFVYLRQLAVHVRSAINAKKASATKAHAAVYNWQVVNCLRAWSAVICSHGSDEASQMRLLAFPLVQTTLALARLLPATRFVPLRFQCVRLLNEVARALQLHVPVTADLLEVLDKAELGKKPTGVIGRPLDWSCALKVAKGAVGTRAFQDGMVGRMLLHLTDWMSINSTTISFPEMATPVLAELSKAARSAKTQRFQRQLKHLIATVRKCCANMLEARSRVSFAPKDLDRVREFERTFAARGATPLQTLLRDERRAAETRDAQFGDDAIVGDDDDESDDDGARSKGKGAAKRRGSDSDEEGDDDGDEREEAPAGKAKPAAASKRKKGPKGAAAKPAALPARPARLVNSGSDDLVRDFDAGEFFS